MKRKFLKMHGLGNDFVIFDGRDDGFSLPSQEIQRIGDRRRGIGFDQMIILYPAKSKTSDVFMKIYNNDGSEVSACGNATRCVADRLLQKLTKDQIVIETKAAQLKCRRDGDKIAVDMGKALLEWQKIPLSHEADTLSLPIVEGAFSPPVGVNMGNPHAVFFVDDVINVSLEKIGPRIEHHSLFPERTNVEFAQILSRTKIRMRVWERGAGITQACGTGACATGVAAVRRGLTERKVEIRLDGGSLDIEWRESDGHVLMTGDSALAYEGEIDVS